MEIPAKQYLDWANRIVAGEHLEEEMQNAGALPNANTPLPPTNAAIHLLDHEIGYGTSERQFVALCGVSWLSKGSAGEHKYFMAGEHSWHKHINCGACRKLMGNEHE